jgi:hypothetical protein
MDAHAMNAASRRSYRNTLFAISLFVVCLVSTSVVVCAFHSHHDGCCNHDDCPACLWLCEAVAVAAFFLLLACPAPAGIIVLVGSVACHVQPLREKNGRAPPTSLLH